MGERIEMEKRMYELPAYPHVMTGEEVCGYFETTYESGLTDKQVSRLRARFGLNQLAEKEGKSLLALIAEQFEDTLVRILLTAAIVSFILAVTEDSSEGFAAFVEPLVILLILIANAIVSIWQESNAEKSLEALKKLQPDVARVLRNSHWRTLPAEELVPGDIVEVRVGDRIPADLRILKLETTTLKVEQSQLTGEARSVCKVSEPLVKSSGSAAGLGGIPEHILECEIQAKNNMLFSTTTVTHGRAIGVVIGSGMDTEIGRIQAAVSAAADEEESSPLQLKLNEFSDQLTKVIGAICLTVWLINFNHFSVHGSYVKGCIYYFKIAVALAVAAIPEGLPAVITTCLALGTNRMAKKHAIVRKLLSVETLGCTTVICSDKTGTLTTNEMSCVQMSLFEADGSLNQFEIEGHDFSSVGKVWKCSEPPMPVKYPADDAMSNYDTRSRQPHQNNMTQQPNVGHHGAAGHSDIMRAGSPSLRPGRRLFEHIDHAMINMQYLVRVCCLCTESTLETSGDDRVKIRGEPTEGALKILVEKLGCPDFTLNAKALQRPFNQRQLQCPLEAFCDYWASDLEKLATLEFSRDRKSMSVLCRLRCGPASGPIGDCILLVKGAPEGILERTTSYMAPNGQRFPLNPLVKQAILKRISSMASSALRTMAIAVRFNCAEFNGYNGPTHPAHRILLETDNFVSVEQDLCMIGLVGLLDPPRPEVSRAIRECHEAGIRVIMITGDNKLTAEAIARKCGLLGHRDPRGGREGKRDGSGQIMGAQLVEYDEFDEICSKVSYTGREFESLSEEAKYHVLSSSRGCIFSRTEPKHKQLIIKYLKQIGEVVAMTGDGVNDAPALKQADIGISMGITGTEVAKEASDMILADDNFNTIVSAVAEGRSIYNNMKAFIRYLISSNIGEVASIFITAALGVPEGLAPVQLLWVNLVTDGLPATALGFNPPDLDVMYKQPRKKDEKLITRWVLFRYFTIGIYVGLATVGIFVQYYLDGVSTSSDGHSLVTYHQLTHFAACHTWTDFWVKPVYSMDEKDPCTFFQTEGKVKASTLSLTVLVVIEMLNAFNALSEDYSILQLPPWANPSLCLAAAGSILLHCLVLYIPWLARVFGVVPLTFGEWMLVFAWSVPVILIDEILKFTARHKILLRAMPSWFAGNLLLRTRTTFSAASKAH